jgi:hypothetical protein
VELPQQINVTDSTFFEETLKDTVTLFKDAKTTSNCVRRAILLFSDGTPEKQRRVLHGDALESYFQESVIPVFKGDLTNLELNGFYLSGFKTLSNYWTEPQPKWSAVAKLVGTKSDANEDGVPYVQLVSGADIGFKLAERMDDIAASLTGISRVSPSTAGTSDQNLPAKWTVKSDPLQENQSGTVKFQFVDASGNVMTPDSGSSNKWNISLSGAGETFSPQWSGDSYQFSWTPKAAGVYQFTVDATLAGSDGKSVSTCSGGWPLLVPVPIGNTSTIVNVVVGPNDDVQNNTVTVHVKLKYLDQDGSPRPVSWDNTAVVKNPAGDRNLKVTSNTVDETNGLYDIVIGPVDDARKIEANLTAATTLNGNSVQILNTTYPITIAGPVGCFYQGPWTVWFWPLVLLLVLALLVLLLFRYRKERDIKRDREGTSRPRVRYWNLLFLPFAMLLLLAILNKVWWCFVIPLWMFLVVILVLILITVPIRFLPWEVNRGTSSWWIVAMLVLAGLLLVASLIFKASLLWILLAIVSVLIIRWAIYHILFYVPERPLILGFVRLPPCVPSGEAITLPLELMGDENLRWASILTWDVVATTEPQGNAVAARIAPVDADRGEYKLEIDPVDQADCINVVIRATIESDRYDFHTSSLITSIEICDADDLKDLEGIGEGVEKLLHHNGIFTFKKLADTNWLEIEKWLDREPWGKMMNPKTWPQQARLREAAKSTGLEKDWVSYFDYKDWLFDGIEADEYAKPEDKANRRPDVLLWPKERNRISDEEWDAAEERFSQRVKEGLSKARTKKKKSLDGQ